MNIKSIRRETREVIFKVFIRCLAEHKAGKLSFELKNVYQRTADLTGKSVSTVRRIAEEGELNDGVFITLAKNRKGRPRKSLDTFDICAIRQKVLYFYTVKKQFPTLRNLLPVVRDELGYEGSRENLRKTLFALGFYYKKRSKERSMLIEKSHISAKREKYLKEILANRSLPEGLQKNIIYLDESYADSSYKLVKCWQAAGQGGINFNFTMGKRYTIMLAGSEKGFVPNTLLICSGIKKNEDYHYEMDHHNFTKWIREKLIPNLSEPSIIVMYSVVMYSAPYHSVVTNKPPTTATKIDDVNLWLLKNNIEFDPTWTKPELLMIVKRHKPEPIYEVDEIFEEYGHTVVRIPPYHCDLNPTELIWAIARHKMASLDEGFPDIRKVAEQALSEITTEDWNNSCEHVVNIENDYYERGRTLYNEMDCLITTYEDSVHSSSSSSEDEFFEA